MSQDDNEVGYCKPPKHSQFKPGNQVAKNRGKRKAQATFSIGEILREAMSSKRKIKRGGEVVDMAVGKILVERLVQMVTSGTARELTMIVAMLERHAPDLLASSAEELAITYHRAEGSKVPLPPADLWKDNQR